MDKSTMAEPYTQQELKNTGYEIFVAILSILSIFNLILASFVQDQDLQLILYFMNALMSFIFLLDFTYRFTTASSRSTYFFRQYGWADLLASLPLAQFKIFRLFRLIRVYRLMREVGIKSIFHRLVKDRAGSALVTLLLMGILVLEFGSVQILAIESQSPDANIKTASDALWYTIVTIATVGYGDRYPTTNAGRLVGSLLIVIGVGIFGTFTGYLANFFLSPPKEKPMPERIQPAPDDLQFRVEQLNQLMAQQQEAIDEINHLLQNR